MHSVEKVTFDLEFLVIHFKDARILAVPKVWFPKLEKATESELVDYVVSPYGIHWKSIDEDISVDGLLSGQASLYSVTEASKMWPNYVELEMYKKEEENQ